MVQGSDDDTATAFVFRKHGEFWTITYAGDTCHLPDSRGFAYLGALLRYPHTPIPATVLSALVRRSTANPASTDADRAATERARVNVTRAINIVLRRIAERLPALGVHLKRSVHTGRSCAYTPDRGDPVSWGIDDGLTRSLPQQPSILTPQPAPRGSGRMVQ